MEQSQFGRAPSVKEPCPSSGTVKQRPIPIGMKDAEMFDSGLSGSPCACVNSNSTDQSELAMSLGAQINLPLL